MRRLLVLFVALVSGLLFASPAIAAPLTVAPLGGGSRLSGPSGHCTAGFAAIDGAEWYLIASPGCSGTVYSGNNVLVGTASGPTTSGASLVHVTSHTDWTLVPMVGDGVTITGSSPAPVGSTVCLIGGGTTGWHCGVITARNVTVNFPEGALTGLTSTNVCHEPGDPAVAFVSGSQAQGVLIGGSGNCSSGGTTYFAPVNPILATYGLQLLTG